MCDLNPRTFCTYATPPLPGHMTPRMVTKGRGHRVRGQMTQSALYADLCADFQGVFFISQGGYKKLIENLILASSEATLVQNQPTDPLPRG